MHVLSLLKIWLKIACKRGHFVSVERFNVRCSQRVGSGPFFSMKLSGYHVVSYLSRLTHSAVELGPFGKITFSEEDPLLCCTDKVGVAVPSSLCCVGLRMHHAFVLG